jgi:short-subunit dehydrogenase
MRLDPQRVAVVTGAASGIGRAVSEALSQRSLRLALVDRDERGLEATAATLRKAGCELSIHAVDVSNSEQMACLPEAVLAHHHGVHLLVNSAGVALAGPLSDVSLHDIEWILGTNVWGLVYACKYFLPHLCRQEEAHIVNILSDFALIGFPTKSAYCASKFAARGFSESLRAELFRSGVGVTCVYPGAVRTNLIRNSRTWNREKKALEERFLAEHGLPAETVAAAALRGIERNLPRVLVGRQTVLIDLAQRLAPAWTASLVARFQQRVTFI